MSEQYVHGGSARESVLQPFDGSTRSGLPQSTPAPIPLKDLRIPSGGAAVVFAPGYCCNLVIAEQDGSVSYEFGSLKTSPSSDPLHPDISWQRFKGTLPTHASIAVDEARQFIAKAAQIPATDTHPVLDEGLRPTFDRGTEYGIVRNGVVNYTLYYGQEDPVFSELGMVHPGDPYREPRPLMSMVPLDAIGFVFNESFFVVHRSGAITFQMGGVPGDFSPASATYDVEPITRWEAWRIVILAPMVFVPSGCPGLDHNQPYLVIVTRSHVSGSLFCHSWSPMRSDLMSIVARV